MIIQELIIQQIKQVLIKQMRVIRMQQVIQQIKQLKQVIILLQVKQFKQVIKLLIILQLVKQFIIQQQVILQFLISKQVERFIIQGEQHIIKVKVKDLQFIKHMKLTNFLRFLYLQELLQHHILFFQQLFLKVHNQFFLKEHIQFFKQVHIQYFLLVHDQHRYHIQLQEYIQFNTQQLLNLRKFFQLEPFHNQHVFFQQDKILI